MREPKGRSKADLAARNRITNGTKVRDWSAVLDAFEQYGNYLLLVGQGHPVGEVRVYETHK